MKIENSERILPEHFGKMVKIFDQVGPVPWLAISATIVFDVLENVLSLYAHKYMPNLR